MRVLFVGDSNSRGAGGLYATISATTNALLAKDIEVALLAFNDSHSREDAKAYGKVPQLLSPGRRAVAFYAWIFTRHPQPDRRVSA